ncbi:MAG: sigma-70 family RNA polymerase sigma factor [Kiritimatiellae bacterium]|nr:sigma-70 family RNA polymerase sigma factor [Kiritimatiellia bacterium]MDW8457773.1 sigma-70 family RNA polymerase sigma factor [Verrucomicrobiota bacterium]
MTESTGLNPERWVDEHADFLYRYALTRVRDHSLAEDLVQETFLAAMKSAPRFREGLSERAWLMGILKHKVVDHIRRAVRETIVDQTEVLELEKSKLFQWAGIPTLRPEKWHVNPRRAFEQKEFWAVFQECLMKLKPREHLAFTLRELEDQDTDTICKELKITPNHLWVMLHRARNSLKACIEAKWTRRNQGSR